MKILDPWFSDNLACPQCRHDLVFEAGRLVCHQNHSFEIVDGVPILLDPTAHLHVPVRTKNLEMLARENTSDSPGVDPYVQLAIAATNGIMYKGLIGKLKDYPIPKIPLPVGDSKWLLDIGCNWGRWSISAARQGYRVVGIDPNSEAIFAARRVAKKMNADARFVVGDARHLPFRSGRFDTIFSYSVLQHFAKEDVLVTFDEIDRVLKAGGESLIEMANAYGLRSFFHQARRRFRTPRNFEVRYWTPNELVEALENHLGKSALKVDGYFSLNPQSTDLELLPLKYRLVVLVSSILKRLASVIPGLAQLADSVYVNSRKPAAPKMAEASLDFHAEQVTHGQVTLGA